MFCSATGFAGTPSVVSTSSGRFDPSRLTPQSDARRIRIHFNADRAEALPWKFFPQQRFVDVLPGESSLAFYKAKNESKRDVIGIATYNVTPDRVGRRIQVHDPATDALTIGRALLFKSGVLLL